MNPAGIVLMIAGIWVGTQVFGGNALKRLNIIKDSNDPDAKTKPPASGFDGGNSGGGSAGGGGGSF